jgi:hypothetical protein
MSDSGEMTPIDRPLLRSDLNEIRQIVWNISQRQIAERRDSVALTAICVVSALVSIGCAVAGLQ